MINMLVTLDANYIPPLMVLLNSLMISNPNELFTLYVAHSSLTTNDISKIASAVEPARCRVAPIEISEKLLEDAPVLDRITKETYYRLLAIDYLPDDVERILYIDPDTVVINPLRSFYDIDFGDNLIAGATHVAGIWETINIKRLKMPRNAKYINAGVLMMNIKGLRNCGITTAHIFEFIRENAKRLYLADQDVINSLYCKKTISLDPCVYNLDEKMFEYRSKDIDLEWVIKNTLIIHYDGKYKPWKPGYRGCLHSFFDAYNDGFMPIPETEKGRGRHERATNRKV